MGLKISLIVNEDVYPNLVKVFYSNMALSISSENQVIANIYRIPIKFNVLDLNGMLGIVDDGLKIYTLGKHLNFLVFICQCRKEHL